MIDAVVWLGSVALMIVALAVTPAGRDSATCAPGFDLAMGIRTSGEFECWSSPPAGCEAAKGPWVPCPKPRITRGRIYCTGGAHPIVVNYRTVGCQR